MNRQIWWIAALIGAAIFFGLYFFLSNSSVQPPEVITQELLTERETTNKDSGEILNPAPNSEKSREEFTRSVSVRGSLLNEAGEGLAEREIVFYSIDRAVALGVTKSPGSKSPDFWENPPATKSDSRGEFSFHGLSTGTYLAAVWTEEHFPVEEKVMIHEGDNQIKLIARGKALTISGSIKDDLGNPLNNVECYATQFYNDTQFADLSDFEKIRVQWLTEFESSTPDGNFTLLGLAPGLYDVFVTMPGYSSVRTRMVDAGTKNLDLVLTRAANLYGQVTNEQGDPISDARIYTQHQFADRVPRFPAGARSKEKGDFNLEVLSGGLTVQVLAQAETYAKVQLPLPVFAPGESRLFNIVLPKAVEISGIVRDPLGKAIEGALILFGPPGQTPLTLSPILTEKEGNFVIPNSKDGESYLLSAEKNGYEKRFFQPVLGGTHNLELVIRPNKRVSFQLIAADGTATFPPFKVEIYSEDEHGRRLSLGSKDFPAGNGNFVWENIPPNYASLTAWVPGFAPAQELNLFSEVGVEQTEAKISIRLHRGRKLEGKVVDKNSGRPLANASVLVVENSRSGRLRSGGMFGAQSGVDGKFYLEGASAGIEVSHPNYASRLISVSPTQNLDLGNIPLSPGASLLIQVQDEKGSPIAGMSVEIRSGGVEWLELGSTDNQGKFFIEKIAPGHQEISLWDWTATMLGEPYGISRAVNVVEGKQNSVVLALEKTGIIRGRVAWEKQKNPYESPRAAIFVRDQEEHWAWGSLLGNGEYVIRGAPPGECIAYLKSFDLPQRYEVSKPVFVEAGVETRLDFEVSNSGIAGIVSDASNGAKIQSAKLEIAPVDGGEKGLAFSQADGSFGVIGLAPKNYKIKAAKEGYATESFGPFDVSADRVNEGIAIRLQMQGILRVLARTRDGAAVSNCVMKISGLPRERQADASGVAVFDQLAKGRYEIEAQASGFAKAKFGPVDVEFGKQSEATLSLRRLCALRVKVEGISISRLELTDLETGEARTAALANGSNEIFVNELAEGRWKLVAHRENQSSIEREVELNAAQEAQIFLHSD